MKTKTSQNKKPKKPKTDADRLMNLLKEKFGANIRVIGVRLPDPAVVGAEKFHAAAEKAIKAKLKEEVGACTKALFEKAVEWPMPVALQALENVFLMAIDNLGTEEGECLRAHLEKFHAEITLLNVESESSTVH